MKNLTQEEALSIIRTLSNEEVLSNLNKAGLTVEWKAIFDTFSDGIVVERSKMGVPPEKESRFDKSPIDKAAPVLKGLDAPKPLSEVREELSELIRETDDYATGRDKLRLLGIIEQIVMHLENVPKFNWSIPGIAPFPMCPQVPLTPQIWPPHTPYVGDPPPGTGPTTICGTVTRPEAMCQADGYAEKI